MMGIGRLCTYNKRILGQYFPKKINGTSICENNILIFFRYFAWYQEKRVYAQDRNVFLHDNQQCEMPTSKSIYQKNINIGLTVVNQV